MSFLIDTNVVSELARPRPDRRVVVWSETAGVASSYLSVLTIGEIAKGVAKLQQRNAAAGAALHDWLVGLQQQYADRIIDIDTEVAQAWGRIASRRSVPVIDALLAATALVHDLTLVTRHERDVADLGVDVLNPWNV